MKQRKSYDGHCWPSNSFYDRKVQKALREWRDCYETIPKCVLDKTKNFARPIAVFTAFDELASDQPTKVQRHGDALYWYGLNPLPTAQLLVVLTECYEWYYSPPPWPRERLPQILIDLAYKKQTRIDGVKMRRAAVFGTPVDKVETLPALKWDVIAAEIAEEHEFKHLTGDHLRTRTFPYEVARRRKIREEWAANFEAFADVAKWKVDL